MKKSLTTLSILFISLAFGAFSVQKVDADVAYSQAVTLSSGWNIVSTPRVLESHSFSVAETSNNFDIYALDASEVSGWATLADLGQTEFTPLYGYFINNKTGVNQTLTFNYKADIPPNEALFDRTFSTTGWYSFGIANPTYTLSVGTVSSTDTNNPTNILSSLSGFYDTVVDLTDGLFSSNPDAVGVATAWKAATVSDIATLNDFRETKGYAVFLMETGALYNGFQNNTIPACSDGTDNDSDGLIDMADDGCVNSLDNDETNATIALSLNSGTPVANQTICSSGTDEDECDELELLRINFEAGGSNATITNLFATITRSGNTSTATSSTAYIYDGATLIGSASVAGTSATAMTATFSDIDWAVPVDTTKVLTLKVDIRDAGTTATTFSAFVTATGIVADNVAEADISGSATGNVITVNKIGPEITLISKSISTSGVPQGSGGSLSTSTVTATFNVRVKAVGGDIYLGKVASDTPAFAKTGIINSFQLYVGGSASSVNVATSTSYTIPTACVDATPANTCTLAEGSSVDISVTYLIAGRLADGTTITSGLYAVGLEKVNWAPSSTGAIQSTDFMAGLTSWRTAEVSFP